MLFELNFQYFLNILNITLLLYVQEVNAIWFFLRMMLIKKSKKIHTYIMI